VASTASLCKKYWLVISQQVWLARCQVRDMRIHHLWKTKLVPLVSLVVVGTVAVGLFSQTAASTETTFEFNDVHFQLTTYPIPQIAGCG
jgi:hypothetical protein